MRFDDGDVRAVDFAIRRHIFAEIRGVDRRSALRLGLADVRSVDAAVGGGITKQHAHWYRDVAPIRAIVHPK